MWKFYLNNTEVEEPIGWDSIQFFLRRSKQLSGMEFVFSDTLTFSGDGYKILATAYDTYDVDAEVTLRITDCDLFDETFGANFNSYDRNRGARTVQIGLKQLTFAELFKTRMETEVNLESLLSLENTSLSAPKTKDIRLHGKTIYQAAQYQINQGLPDDYQIYQQSGKDTSAKAFHITPPWEATVTDLDGYREASYYTPADDYPLLFSGDYPEGVSKRSIKVEFRYKQNILSLSRRYRTIAGSTPVMSNKGKLRFSLVVKNLDNEVIQEYPIAYKDSINTGAELMSSPPFPPGAPLTGPGYDYDSGVVKILVEMPENTKLVFDFFWEAESLSASGNINGYDYNFKATIDKEVSYLKMEEDSIFPDSNAKGFLIFDAFERCIAMYTGIENALESDYFSGPQKPTAITNGLNVRSMLDKNGKLFPVTTSFKNLFDGANAIFNLGMRVENDKIRIEPKSYFFSRQVRNVFLNVNDIKEAPSLDDIYNEFEIGYQKWETEQTNGIDEFNSSRNYALPIRSVQNKLPQLSSLIASGYIIEFCRRQQYKAEPTTDYRNDNDLFIIAVIETMDGYISEKGAKKANNANVFSPGTAYNVRFTPKRNADRWANILAGCVAKKPAPKGTFTSGKANYQAKLDGIQEDSDLQLAVPFLYQPQLIRFSYPITFSEFMQLKADAIHIIAVGCGDEIEYEGFIKEVTYKPNKAGGIAEFILIRG